MSLHETETDVGGKDLRLSEVDLCLPVSAFSFWDEGSATVATQSFFSLERGHSSSPPASNRLSLENSAGSREADKC